MRNILRDISLKSVEKIGTGFQKHPVATSSIVGASIGLMPGITTGAFIGGTQDEPGKGALIGAGIGIGVGALGGNIAIRQMAKTANTDIPGLGRELLQGLGHDGIGL